MRLALFSALVLACEPPPRIHAPGIAVAADFDGYERWQRFELGMSDAGLGGDGGVHAFGFLRRLYINALPASGARPFPIGTLIVKEEPFDTLVMAKRGGSYNENGARGWEWMELGRTTTGAIAIKWRGLGPPQGEEYKSAGTTCNDCHRAHPRNDSVLSDALQ
jgi:hypothetical protein